MRMRGSQVGRHRSPRQRRYEPQSLRGLSSRKHEHRARNFDDYGRAPSRRSLSPRERRKFGIKRRSISPEGRGYERFADEGFSRGRSPFHVRKPSPFDSRGLPLSIGDREVRVVSQPTEVSSGKGVSPNEFRHNYGVNVHAVSGLRKFEIGEKIRDEDFQRVATNLSSDMDGHNFVHKNPLLSDSRNGNLMFGERGAFDGATLSKFAGIGSSSDIGRPDIVRPNLAYDWFRHSAGFDSKLKSLQQPYEDSGERREKFCAQDASAAPQRPLSPTRRTLGNSVLVLPDVPLSHSYDASLGFKQYGFGTGEKVPEAGTSDRFGSVRFMESINPEMHLKDHHEMHLKDHQRARMSRQRDEHMDFDYSRLGIREHDSSAFENNDRQAKRSVNDRGDYSFRETFQVPNLMRAFGTEMDTLGSLGSLIERASPDLSLRQNPSQNFSDVQPHALSGRALDDFMCTKLPQFPSSDYKRPLRFQEDHTFESETGSVNFRETLKSLEQGGGLERYGYHPSYQHELHRDEFEGFPQDRIPKRRYHDEGTSGQKEWTMPRRLEKDNDHGDDWVRERRHSFAPFDEDDSVPNSSSGRTSPQNASSNIFTAKDGIRKRTGLLGPRSIAGRGIPIKKRLGPNTLGFNHKNGFQRRQIHSQSFKLHKPRRGETSAAVEKEDEKDIEEAVHHPKPEPSEDTEEFKQMVHKAFLQYSKLLNESLGKQRRYQGQGKAGTLLCFACGREFVNTHNLVAHAYHSLKVGTRAGHLGLHKALCVLLGWNSSVAPDTSKEYQSLPEAEAIALKNDLLLWPPVVIICHTSSWNKSSESSQDVNVEHVHEALREMGFAGSAKIHLAQPSYKGVFIAKYLPTFTGLYEAERLHKHFSEHGYGREEYLKLQHTRGSCSVVLQPTSSSESKVNPVTDLFGSIGIAEDLEKLDHEMKRRCTVKSRKDIEAIADAPLKLE